MNGTGLTKPDPAVVAEAAEVVKGLSDEHPTLGMTVTEEWVNIYTVGADIEARRAGLLAAAEALEQRGLRGVLMALAIIAIEPLPPARLSVAATGDHPVT